MNGINTFFHLAAAVGTVLFIYLLLRLRRQRDVLRALLAAVAPAGPRGRRVEVLTPLAFLQAFAAALQVPITEDEGVQAGAPARITATPWTELFLRHELLLISCQRCAGQPFQVHVTLRQPAAATAPSAGTVAKLVDSSPTWLAASATADTQLRLAPLLAAALGGQIPVIVAMAPGDPQA